MNLERVCETCKKEFRLRRKDQVGRFCSHACRLKVLRKEQLEQYRKYLQDETEEQRLHALIKRFEKYVIKKDGCWDWKASKISGYGTMWYRGKHMKAHRASWILHNGPIPDEMWVLHSCDNRHCSNPQHLFLGNNSDNMKDMASKHRTGVRCKLTLQQVYEIKGLLKLEVPMANIARRYKVSTNAIYEIKHGLSWKKAV